MNKLLLVIFFLVPVQLYAQNKTGNRIIESLLQELSKAQDDSGKVKLFYRLAVNYQDTNPDEGNRYGEGGLDLAEKLNWEKGIVVIANFLGDNYADRSRYAKALECYYKALRIHEASGHKLSEAETLCKIGNVYDDQGNYPKALEAENKVLKIAEELQDKKGKAASLCNLGKIYLDIAKNAPRSDEQGVRKLNLNTSIEYSNKSVQACDEVGDEEHLKMAYKNLYAAHKMSGNVKGALDNYKKMIALKHTIFNSKKAKESVQKQLEYEYGRREDSMRSLQKIANEKIKEQSEVVSQQQQKLQATSKTLSLTEKEKEAARNALQQTQTDLSLEKNNSEAKTKQLTLAEEESALQATRLQLQQSELERKDEALETRRKERYFYILGIAGSLAFSLFAYRSFRLQKKYNRALVKEKRRSEELLLNILPVEVAEELMEKGFTDAKHFDNVTVLFTDFISFTSAAERMPPKQLVGELHVCFKAFDEILSKYQIEKIKTVGDAYLAVSGLPLSNPNHATDIVAAAIEIRDFMVNRRAKLGDDTFCVRLGINSGSVVAGIVGVTKYAYDIWGDAVNVAARMEQSSEDGKINISETTYELVKNKYKFLYRGKVEAKNKGNVDMYYLVS